MSARVWRKSSGLESNYFRKFWNAVDVRGYAIVERKDLPDKYWVSPQTPGDENDVGPFDTFDAAAAAFETLIGAQ